MGDNRDRVLRDCQPPLEVPFGVAEYRERLASEWEDTTRSRVKAT